MQRLTISKNEGFLGMKPSLCLHQLFQQQAKRTPATVAVVDGDTQLTYQQLDEMSDTLAGYLQQHGLTTNRIAAIFMEKCIDYVVAYIAILKAGGAYLPLDLAYPNILIEKIVAESKPDVLITKQGYLNRVQSLQTTVLDIEDRSVWNDYQYDPAQAKDTTLDSLAYVVYSSGTTGEPKGILAPHRGSVHSYNRRYDFSPYHVGDRVACNVFFVWELMRPLLHGSTIYVIPDDIIYDPLPLLDFIASHEITEVLFTPSLLETVINTADQATLQYKMASLQVLWLNGEVVTTRLKNRMIANLPAHIRLLNTYSISECHDVANENLRETEELISGICLVGQPIPDISLKLMDEALQPVPSGAVGELYVGGPGLARGYLNKPQLTAERFIMIEGKRYYKTGDLARLHANGKLEIQGRCDFMVKIRGYSVHLGAIETALLENTAVKSCAVLPEGAEGEDKRLVAYLVRQEQATWKINPRTGGCVEIQNRIKPYLAHYMIPTVYIEVDNLPVSNSGKLDRSRLPTAPPRKQSNRLQTIQLSQSPTRLEQEEVMAKLWEHVLQLDSGTVQIDSNFFDFGGHSLLAAELAVTIKQIFGVQLMVKDIYASPTLGHLLNRLTTEPNNHYNSTNFAKDAILDPTIVPPASHKPASLDKAKAIMLTGATGFLGAFILDELLRTTDSETEIHCLVRVSSGNPTDGLKRIITNLKQYNLWNHHYETRIKPMVGDLTKPYLGLSAEQFNQYAKNIDLIFHAGALVNYVYAYEVLKPSMVTGTHEILRLACTHITKPVHYVSTNGVFPGNDSDPYLENREISAFAERLEGGYGPAKWVAEMLVWQAVDRNLPVCIYRPGNIGHHSQTGVVNPNDFQFMIVDACKKLGSAPTNKPWAFEMTPVDFLARSIVQFARQPTFGQVYNVVQANPTPAKAVFDILAEKGHIAKFVTVAEWKQNLQAKSEQNGDYILNVLAESLDDVEPYLLDDSRYDRRNFDQTVTKHGIPETVADIAYFRTFINTTYQNGKTKEPATQWRVLQN